MDPRVSVIVTCYNYARFVAQAVDSLLSQTLEALEVIVIDDASPDDSQQVLERYCDHPRVRLVHHATNQGHIRSYNEGLAMARGEFVGVLAADDFALRTDAAERQVAVFDADPAVGFVYSAFAMANETGQLFREFRPFERDYVRDAYSEFAELMFRNYVPHSGTLVRRACHAEIGVYDTALPHAGDWDLWLRLASRYSVGYIAEPLYAYRVHGTNMSIARYSPRHANGEVLRTVQKAFDALPADAPAWLVHSRGQAIHRALMLTTWGDRSLGRTRRAWVGLMDAAQRSPSLLSRPMFYAAIARLVLLSLLGQTRYERLAHARKVGLQRRGVSPRNGSRETSP
jgi:glycosyltransferase involved in cell wall biosynthesis